MNENWDYIVVGAGSSGCVVAEKLSADPRNRVLVLEAGGESGFWNRVPKGVAKLVTNPDRIWAYPVAQPREENGPANEVWIRGKGVGGSSSVNGMIWSRGEREDYDAWERDHGAAGWNGDSMTEAFLRLEDHPYGPSPMLGSGGPVHVEPEIYTYPLADEMIAAGEALQLKRVRELNEQPGPRVGYYSHNIRRGKRESAARTFLDPARRRPNVRVVTGARAERITFDGKRATGIDVLVDGEMTHFACSGEIVVSAGAIESPLLLQRSGIGDAAWLRGKGVDPLIDNAHVGAHLNEHLSLSMPYRLKSGKGTNRQFYGAGAALAMARYMLTGGGIMATGPFEVGAFLNVAHPDGRVDAQFYLGAYTFEVGDENNPVPLDKIDRQPGITIYASLLRLSSEGSIRIGGADLSDAPDIQPNFLSTEHDRASAVALVRRMRAFMDAPPLGARVGDELLPGRDVDGDEAILAFFRRYSTCGLHGIGTCRMGSGDNSVVDAQLRVRGVTGVRVADCSVIPGHVTGNTNAPAMAIGLRCADMMRQAPA